MIGKMNKEMDNPQKRQRLNSNGRKNDDRRDNVLDDDDDDLFSDERLAHIDAMVSQATQAGSPTRGTSRTVANGTIDIVGGITSSVAPVQGLTWTVSGVVPESGFETSVTKMSSMKPQMSTSKSWNSTSVGFSIQEHEFQKREIQRRRKEAIDAQEQMKSLSDKLLRKELEAERFKCDLEQLRHQVETLTNERNQANKRSEKLQVELNFKNQEIVSTNWPSSQHPVEARMTSTKRPAPESSQSSTTTRNMKTNLHGFPTSSSFVKKLDVIDQPSSVKCNSKLVTKKSEVEAVTKKSFHMETGPGLFALLLAKLNDDLEHDSIILELLKRHRTMDDSIDSSVDNVGPCRSTSTSSSSMSKSSGFHLKIHSDFKFGLLKLLNDDDSGADNVNINMKNIDELVPLRTGLGMREDCAASLLHPVENTIGLLESPRQPPSSRHVSLPPSSTVHSASIYSTSGGMINVIEPMVLRVRAALKLLQIIVFYSPNVRHCLLTECDPNAFGCSPCQEMEGTDTVTSQGNCRILTKLIHFCEQPIEMENKRILELLVITLDIFTAIASYCSKEQLTKFLPMLSLIPVRNCVTLSPVSNGSSIFLQFLKFLVALFSSSVDVINGCCCHNDFCLWKPIMETWGKTVIDAKQPDVVKQIDLQMVILLTVSCENATPSFLTSDECRCPFEVISSLILYLDRLRRLRVTNANESDDEDNVLRMATSLLRRIIQLDEQFVVHRQSVDVEFNAFLHWLPRVHRRLKLDKNAEIIMGMWNLSSNDER